MKKTLLNLALVATLASVSAQGINTVGAYDDFAKTSQYSVISTEMLLDSTTHVGNPAKKAYKGIFWWTKPATGGLNFTKTRLGDGKQSYVATQAASAYEPLGVGFGTYAKSATPGDSSFFTVDLSNNAVVSFTIKNTSGADQLFKVGLSDINDTLLNAYATPLAGYNNAGAAKGDIATEDNAAHDAPYYQYELNITVKKDSTKNVSIDFKGAAHVFYKLNVDGTVRTSGGNIGCKDVGYYSPASTFNFAKVKAFTITPLNSEGTNSGPYPDCYGQKELTAGTFEVTNFRIGDVSGIVGVSDEIIANFKDEVVTVYNFSGAYVAQGNVADLNLASGFYIFKSASKAVKTFVK